VKTPRSFSFREPYTEKIAGIKVHIERIKAGIDVLNRAEYLVLVAAKLELPIVLVAMGRRGVDTVLSLINEMHRGVRITAVGIALCCYEQNGITAGIHIEHGDLLAVHNELMNSRKKARKP
jgi:phosphoribosylcarboxyaminoimidazole (NCAIR) mutase